MPAIASADHVYCNIYLPAPEAVKRIGTFFAAVVNWLFLRLALIGSTVCSIARFRLGPSQPPLAVTRETLLTRAELSNGYY